MQSDPYPHHVYALPPAKKLKCTGAIPKIRTTPNPVDAPEPMQFTAQDQRAFIAISFKSGTPVQQVIETLKRSTGRHAYSENYITF